MKKYLAGCLVFALLTLGVGGVALWFLVLKPASQIAGDAVDSARAGLGQIANIAKAVETMRRLDEKIINRGEYAAPVDGRIDAGQIERFLVIQNTTIGVLGPEFAKLESARQAEGLQPIADGFSALARLGETGIAAKTAQIEALNGQVMSLDEYRWIRRTGIASLVAGGVSAAWLEAESATGGFAEAARRASQEAIDATAGASEGIARVRGAAEAASAALRGEKPASIEAPSQSSSQPSTTDPSDEPVAASSDASVEQANLALVAPHAEAFMRAKLLATLAL